MKEYFPLHFTEKTEISRGLSSNQSKNMDRLECWVRDPSRIPNRSSEYKLTIVWDLDQTLVSADGIDNEDPDDDDTQLVLRPYAELILIALRKNKDVEFIVWTAGTESHAKRVVNSFKHLHFDYVISRNNTWYNEDNQMKDLRIINRDINTVILVDDRMDIGINHPENLIVVAPYYPKEKNHNDDTTLLFLANILQKAIDDYVKCEDKDKNFSAFLFSPLTEKCIYNNLYYYGVKSFSSKDEIKERIKFF